MEMHQLRYALAVADHGTFTAAAAACFVAQPSLSQAVQSARARARRRAVPPARPPGHAHAGRRGVRAGGAGDAQSARRRSGPAVAAVAGLDRGHLDLVALPTLAVDPVAAARRPLPRRPPRCPGAPGAARRHRRAWCAGRAAAEPRSGSPRRPWPTTGSWPTRSAARTCVAVLPPGSRRPRRRLASARLAALPLVTLPAGTSSRRLLDEALAGGRCHAPDRRRDRAARGARSAGARRRRRRRAAPAHGDEAARRGRRRGPARSAGPRDLALVHRDAPLSPAAAAFVGLATGAAAEIDRDPTVCLPQPAVAGTDCRGPGRSRAAVGLIDTLYWVRPVPSAG